MSETAETPTMSARIEEQREQELAQESRLGAAVDGSRAAMDWASEHVEPEESDHDRWLKTPSGTLARETSEQVEAAEAGSMARHAAQAAEQRLLSSAVAALHEGELEPHVIAEHLASVAPGAAARFAESWSAYEHGFDSPEEMAAFSAEFAEPPTAEEFMQQQQFHAQLQAQALVNAHAAEQQRLVAEAEQQRLNELEAVVEDARDRLPGFEKRAPAVMNAMQLLAQNGAVVDSAPAAAELLEKSYRATIEVEKARAVGELKAAMFGEDLHREATRNATGPIPRYSREAAIGFYTQQQLATVDAARLQPRAPAAERAATFKQALHEVLFDNPADLRRGYTHHPAPAPPAKRKR